MIEPGGWQFRLIRIKPNSNKRDIDVPLTVVTSRVSAHQVEKILEEYDRGELSPYTVTIRLSRLILCTGSEIYIRLYLHESMIDG